jgi:hypothetical protein
MTFLINLDFNSSFGCGYGNSPCTIEHNFGYSNYDSNDSEEFLVTGSDLKKVSLQDDSDADLDVAPKSQSEYSGNPRVLILGAGGHGVITLMDLIRDENYSFRVLYTTADWGGSQGLWGRLLEHNNYFLDKKIHHKRSSFLPFGDANKLITKFAIEKIGEVGKNLDFRSNDYRQIVTKWQELNDALGLGVEFAKDFVFYLRQIFAYFESNPIDYHKEFCLGYALHHYIYYQSGWNLGEWSKFWQDQGILPRHIEITFCASHRHILTAKTFQGKILYGEDAIDKYRETIKINTFKLLNPDDTFAHMSVGFWRMIESVDIVIIPNGSSYNWLPLINHFGVQKILTTKKIVWLVNPYFAKSDQNLTTFLNYFGKIGLRFISLNNEFANNSRTKNILKIDKNGLYNSEYLCEVLKLIIAKNCG